MPRLDPPRKGRPPKPPEERLVTANIRLRPAEALKLRALGREWLQARIRAAKVMA